MYCMEKDKSSDMILLAEMAFMPVSLRKICLSKPLDEYHCKKLRDLFTCAFLTGKYPKSEEIKEYCKHRNNFAGDTKWNLVYHTQHLTAQMAIADGLAILQDGKEKLESFGVKVFDKN